MTDIEVTRDATGELMVAGVTGLTDAGIAFCDSWVPRRAGAGLYVVDADRLVIEEEDLAAFIAEARSRGLQVAE